ncbi:DNA polymerase alpha catalytic subunit-like isoform X3 [Salvelinus sp. IW2-2015]|uniref:DNA polymerase alpha catalytic subunit-like isoform X3 n=1 Tax=Salvelinus sp. IW2-2015 TaxID=2691554 RepID=UPI000CDF71ED
MPFLEAGGLLGVIGKAGKSSSDTGMTVVWQLKRAKGEKVKYEVADLTSVYDEADEELSDGERGRTMTGSLMMFS